MSSSKPALGRRRWGVTIRLLIVLLMTGVLSWVGVTLYSASQQRKAVQAIVQSGGEVGYDYEFLPNGYPLPYPTPPGPEWFRTLFGRDVLADVVVVDIPNDPGALTYLARFPKLRDLYVGGARAGEVLPITDDDLGQLEHLANLRVLSLGHCQITDAALWHIGKCAGLEHLYLSHTPITCIRYLNTLSNLETLFLSHTNVSDAGLKHVATLESLRFLSLTATRVTNEGVNNLRHALPNCTIRSDSGALWRQGKDDIPDQGTSGACLHVTL